MGGSDRDLIEMAVAGDRNALVTLLETHTPTLRQRLAGKIPPRWRAVLSVDDLLQETYIDAFLGIGRFVCRHDKAFSNWLCTIATRNSINAVKMLEAEKRGLNRRAVRVPRDQGTSCAALYEVLATTHSTPSGHVACNEACETLNSAIQQLPEHYRQVVEMYDIEGRDMEEVARTLSRSPGAVHMMRFRAHRQLEALLGNVSKYLTTA